MENNKFISGIYNYCDRWCERCDFTDRCRVFFEEKKQLEQLEDKDNFLKIVSKNFEETIKLLYKIAEEKNIDLDNIEVDDDEYKKQREKQANAMNHPMVKLAAAYANQVNDWLDSHDHLEAENTKYLKNIDLGIDLEQSDKVLRTIEEALNIINWYKFQLQVKLASALRSYPHDPMFEDEIQNRHHMSAKIVMIGIQNSMKAWQSLLEILDDDDSKIIDILLQLHQLQTKINQKFPLLPKFKRPGFDD